MTGTTRDARRAATAQRILAAARAEFGKHGFEGATVRGIAARAGVHASLVMQHYGTKAALFESAAELPHDDASTAADHLTAVLDARLTDLPPETRALMRSMLTTPEAQEFMRNHLEERVENLTASLEGDDAEVRALLAVCTILGLTIARHFLALPAFDRVPPEALLSAARPPAPTASPSPHG